MDTDVEVARVPAAVAEALRSDVLAVRIRPGDGVTEASVAARFKVSRPTARIAIDQLVRAGLLRREPNRGARVPLLSRLDIADLYDNRALVTAQPSLRLARMHESLMGEIELCIGQVQANALWRPADIAAQHAHILDAVVAGDAPRATRLVHEHIQGSRDRLLAHVDATAQHHDRKAPQ